MEVFRGHFLWNPGFGEDLCFPFFLTSGFSIFYRDEIWIYRAGVCFSHNGTSFPISSAARQVDGAINGK